MALRLARLSMVALLGLPSVKPISSRSWTNAAPAPRAKRLKEQMDIPDEMNDYFVSAWNARNWIVHDFLHKCVGFLHIPKGRIDAIDMLIEKRRKIKLADVLGNKLLDMYMEKYGLSVADLKRNADIIWDQMNPDQSNSVH